MTWSGVLLLGLVVAGTGCESAPGRSAAATKVTSDFHQALADHDGRAACRLLAPQTRAELEQSAGRPCSQAVLEQNVPGAGGTDRVEVYGDQALVTSAGDATFLAAFSTGWKVTAAGCHARGERPYQCTIKGG